MDTKINVSKVDEAINAAKARKAARKEASPTATSNAAATPKAAKAPRTPDPEKAAAKVAKAAEKLAAKAEKDAARAAKKAAKAASTPAKGPAHLRKVAKAAEMLTSLSPAATLLFNEATANLTQADLAGLAQHINHFNRKNATVRALSSKVEVGQSVSIVGGDPRYIGRAGTVTKAQRIRCYVAVEGVNKPIYCFTSDVAPMDVGVAVSA